MQTFRNIYAETGISLFYETEQKAQKGKISYFVLQVRYRNLLYDRGEVTIQWGRKDDLILG